MSLLWESRGEEEEGLALSGHALETCHSEQVSKIIVCNEADDGN